MKNTLPKIKIRSKKILGRGYGSGKGGHTSSRGQKGQKTRRTIGVLFEGVKMKKSFIKRLPFMRGRGKLKPQVKAFPVLLSDLNVFKDGETVNINSLVERGFISEKDSLARGVKVLYSGNFKLKLKIDLPISKSAREAVEKAGGEIVLNK